MVVFTAADGGQLWADFEGGFTSPPTAEGASTCVGGTGRFSDAAGAVSFDATMGSIHLAITFVGTIAY